MSVSELIRNKYNFSKKKYKYVFTNEYTDVFLYFYDMMNILPLFPKMINIKIKNDTKNIKPNHIGNKSKETKYNYSLTKEYENLKKKWESLNEMVMEKINKMSFKIPLSHNLVNFISDVYDIDNINIGWIKCYEIISRFKLLKLKPENNTIHYIDICNYDVNYKSAIKYYIDTHTDFDFKSNKINKNLTIKEIKNYVKKYKNKKIYLITSNCGRDIDNYHKNLFGQFLLSISLCSEGTNYFYKQNLIHDDIGRDIIYFLSHFFEKVYICLPLVKHNGKPYVVCKNFMKNQELTNIIDKLYDYYQKENYKSLLNFNLKKKFMNQIDLMYEMIFMRKIIYHYYMLFLANNIDYIELYKKDIKQYINKLHKHYNIYFIKSYNIK
jgi:hypothetical protein